MASSRVSSAWWLLIPLALVIAYASGQAGNSGSSGGRSGNSTTGTARATALGHSQRVSTEEVADPGLDRTGDGRYSLYSSGAGFPVRLSSSPEQGYGTPTTSMAQRPAWVAKNQSKLWAPQVFEASEGGQPIWVMYFTGRSAEQGVNCIGAAKSSRADGGFVAFDRPVLCAEDADRGYEAVDPTSFQAADGSRYLIYKVDKGNRSGFDIRAMAMDTPGTGRAAESLDRSLIKPDPNLPVNEQRIEAPSVITHDGKVWLFASRGYWADCTYSTDAWVADSLWTGTFRRVGTVLQSNVAKGVCGPGSATVMQDGKTTRIAYQAYADDNHNGVRDSVDRRAWVGIIRWTFGKPRLY